MQLWLWIVLLRGSFGHAPRCVVSALAAARRSLFAYARVRMAERVRQFRIARRLTQKQLANRLHSKQAHIARLEQGDASLELMMRALLVMGESTKKIARALAA